jgi:peroxiredoxin Q/BCP
MRWVVVSVVIAVFSLVGSENVVGKAKNKDKGKDKPKVVPGMKVGEIAPPFEAVDETGKIVKSGALIGKNPVILFFYPADFTANTVAQVRGYKEEFENLSKAGVTVIGVSGDKATTHQLFKSYYKLPFTLLADEEGVAAKAFGIPVGKPGKSPTIDEKDKKSEADRAVTIERVTVVIDKAGKIAAIDAVPGSGKSASVSDDAKRVAEIVKKLSSK